MNKQKLSKHFARIVYIVTNIFLVLVSILIVSNFELIRSEPKQALIFMTTNLTLPVGFYFYLLLIRKKNIFNFPTINRQDRYVVYLTAIFSFLVTTILFALTEQNILWSYNSMLLCIFFSVFYMINKYIDKISFQVGLFAFSMIYMIDKVNILFVIFLALLPIIFWSRIKLKHHTWFQLGLGVVIGMFIGLLSWTF